MTLRVWYERHSWWLDAVIYAILCVATFFIILND